MEKSSEHRNKLPNWKVIWGDKIRLSFNEDLFFIRFEGAGDMTEADRRINLGILEKLLSEKYS